MRNLHKLIFVAIATLAAGTAMAGDWKVASGQALGQLSELTPDERARFRERWQEMSPDQRDAVRDRLRQDWRSMPPEKRQQLMERLRERDNGQPPGRNRREQDDGYGRGYGSRS